MIEQSKKEYAGVERFRGATAVLRTIYGFARTATLLFLNPLNRKKTEESSQKMRAWAEINLENLKHNAKVLQAALPCGSNIMAVVKADAYGHGDVEIAACLNQAGIRSFAVATIDEAIRLRKKRIKGDILILGYTSAARASELSRYRLMQTAVDVEHAKELNSCRKNINVHVKVNTGMHRLGESSSNRSSISEVFHLEHLTVKGIFTHLAAADSLKKSDIIFTYMQITRFYELLEQLKIEQTPIPATHIQSSYGVLNYPGVHCTYARIGIALYGILSSEDQTRTLIDLKPVLTLKSKISLIRTIRPGESAGYGRAFVAQKTVKMAVVSIGYADGLPRNLSEKQSAVLIRQSRAPIIGRVCMDQIMVDVTGIAEASRGDTVTVIGRDGSEEITAEQLAAKAGTITNELLSRLGGRLEKVFLGC